jgi:membrane protein DedA with SNARE-associated domain
MPNVAQLIEFVASNGYLSGPLSFLVAFIASLLGPNFFVPGGTILIAIGTLAGSQLIPWTVCLWASAGAAAGSAVSFGLGVWLGPKILNSRYLRERRPLVDRAHRLFESYGFAAVFLGYFSGPLRAVVVTTAGVAAMSALRFHVVNVVAAFVWGPVFIGQGAVFGALVDRNQPLVLIMPVAAPVLITMISVILIFAWRRYGRSGRT